MITIADGQTDTKDPSDIRVYCFDWGTSNLPEGVSIDASSVVIAAVHPDGNTELTKDQEAILDGDRSTRVRLSGGTLGAKYRVTNRIVTDETPSQTKDRSFYVLIAER